MTNFIDTFKKDDELYVVHAEESVSAITAVSATTASNVDNIGKVRKYSGNYDGKQREGLQFVNTADQGSEALIELNSKGNFAVESLTKHLNLESAKGIQMKPSTNIILDSTRRIILGKGNEVQVEAKFDDFGDIHGYDGDDEEWAELKINSRNLDLRCHDHGGIALQIAGKDKTGFENKIKFESDRTSPISEQGTYNGEGGKGLEFGTFNNEHSSLFTRDYRFNKYGFVYAVERDAPVYDSGKVDYPTQPDDFKDIINGTTPVTQWKDIVNVSEKYKQLKDFTTESDVQALITQRAAELASGGSISLDGYATEQYVDDAIAQIETGTYEPGNGISIIDNVISVNNYSQILPLTALTDDIQALSSIEITDKGNLEIENKGDFSFEALTDADDEFGNLVAKGDKVVSNNLEYYEADDAYFYKAKVDTVFFDGTPAPAKSVVFMKDVEDYPAELEYYDNPDYYYKAKYATVDYYGNEVPEKWTINKSDMVEPDEEAFYQDTHKYGYKCLVDGALDENGNPKAKKDVVDITDITNEKFYKNNPIEWEKIMTWERVDIWEKSIIWERNAVNINIETDSKIKLCGEKLEMFFKDDEDTGEMAPCKETTIVATEVFPLITKLSFERSVSKNGVETGADPIVSFTYKNNVKDPTKVPDFEAFKAGWVTKHTIPRTDEELLEIYNRLLNEPDIPSATVRLSTLLGLVARVTELESIVENLTSRIEALEGGGQE
jgi:hypothetical protein